MSIIRKTLVLLGLSLCSTLVSGQAATVLYHERVVELQEVLPDATDLWVKPEDLTRINDFELKPQGACFEEICIPVLQDRDSELYITRQNQGWFNVTELADKLQQAYVVDYQDGIWAFGEMPVKRQSFLRGGQAPDFELPDRDGNLVSLSDFRGKKVLLLTWASW